MAEHAGHEGIALSLREPGSRAKQGPGGAQTEPSACPTVRRCRAGPAGSGSADLALGTCRSARLYVKIPCAWGYRPSGARSEAFVIPGSFPAPADVHPLHPSPPVACPGSPMQTSVPEEEQHGLFRQAARWSNAFPPADMGVACGPAGT